TFYDGDPDTGAPVLAVETIEERLQPGQYRDLVIPITVRALQGEHTLYVVADHDSNGVEKVAEPDEDNNRGTTTVWFFNRAPEIVSAPVLQTVPRTNYSYQMVAQDPDGHALSYRLMIAPGHMTIDSTGSIFWWNYAHWHYQETGATVKVAVTDPYGGEAIQEFVIEVSPPADNEPPVFVSTPILTAEEGVDYTYDVDATDADGDVLFYSLPVMDNDTIQTPPLGMTINSETGVIAWNPLPWHSGENRVIVSVTDGYAEATQDFTILVGEGINRDPVFVSIAPTDAVEGFVWEYHVEADDYDLDSVRFVLVERPSGMTVVPYDRRSADISWMPTIDAVGEHTVTVKAYDGKGGEATQTFTVTVSEHNDPPAILSTAPTTVVEGVDYVYAVTATDADRDPITYALIAAPAGMTIDGAGVVRWPDDGTRVASAFVEVEVADDQGLTVRQAWTVTVVPDEQPPVVRIECSFSPAAPNEKVVITVAASDNVGVVDRRLELDYSLVTLDASYQYSFVSSVEDSVVLTARATDAAGNEGTASRVLVISNNADNDPPQVALTYAPAAPMVGDDVVFTVTATDERPIDPAMIWLNVDGRYVELSGGTGVWPALKRGTYEAVATVYDGNGNYDDTTVTFMVDVTGTDAVPPTVSLSSPAADSLVLVAADIVGIAGDDNFAYYELSYAPVDGGELREFHRGTTPVTDGVLGSFDATVVENGDYCIRLTAYDIYGNAAYDETRVHVEGQAKIGLFTLTFEDLNVRLPGMGLSVARSYDSRVKARGDFGCGWRLDLRSLRLSENRVQGEGWEIELVDPQEPLQGYTLAGSTPHTVSIAIPGGRTQVFDAVPELYNRFDPTYGQMTYRARPGTYSTLEVLGIDSDVYVQGSELYSLSDLITPFDPHRYRLTFYDGTTYIIDQAAGGITQVVDANGNATSLGPDGITHSTGEAISFTRDTENRITAITDTDNRTITYEYNPHGDLAKVTDAEGNVTRFKYAPNHYLLEIIDARGVRATRTEYDESGRMVRQISPENDTMFFDHDIDNQTEVTTDFNGNQTAYTYDERGNVLSKTDDSGNTWSYEYDSLDNQVATYNPDNTSRGSTYDERGNELSSTDERGYTTTRTYNDMNRLTSEQDPLGRVTTYEYDSRGNLERVIGPDGVVTEVKTYDGFGNVLSEKDALGNLTEYEYDARGRLVGTVDPLGRTNGYVLDSRGNTLTEVNAAGDTTRYAYDNNDNQVMTVNALGDTTRTEYNVFDKVGRQVDARGNATVFEYDLFGQLHRTVAPDSSFTEKEYDAQGNMVVSRDEVGRQTRFVYDHENRMVQTIFNDGSVAETVYDNRGRRVASIDRNGSRTEYAYDAAGNNTLVRDAVGNETTYEYDAAGNRVAMVDALGQRTEYVYDRYNRLTRTLFADGTYRETTYDDAGRKVAERDQAGKITQFAYDAVGNLVSVTDAMGHVTGYTYDERNNRISQTDANGHTTSMAYDALGRLACRTYPNGDQERFVYDRNGNMLVKVDGNGDSTRYTYDRRNREVLRRYTGSGHTVETHYTLAGNRDTVIDHRGMTTYEYGECCGQLERVNNPDGTFLSYEYDANRNRTLLATPWDTTRYTYDPLNRMDSVIAPDGGMTRYFYSAVGNRDSVVHANGTSVGYAYDNLNRLNTVTNYGAGGTVLSRFAYELNDAGIRTAVVEADGSRVDYAYDELYRLTGETRTGTHAYSLAYTYDDVGNRLTKVDSTGSTSYTYNTRDQLLTEAAPGETISYVYDPGGRMISKTDNSGTTTYWWEDNDRMVSVSGPGVSASYVYDHDGRRVQADGKRYLIDNGFQYAQVVAEYDAAQSPTATYVYGLERISQDRGVVSTYLVDGQGSIRQLADAAGNVTDSYWYTAFGGELASSGTTENEFRYTGEQWDPNAGLYYLRARWMNPTVDLFIGTDPVKG
ncbi:MAG: hypothetical protein GF331_18805, partial [Chitinivibrionales bacterium]|nr:hypothetical protein [Chitinivibrionales bacterium]